MTLPPCVSNSLSTKLHSVVVNSKGNENVSPEIQLRSPIFEALDKLRLALDTAIEQGNEDAAGLLIWAISDIADTIDLLEINRDPFEVLSR